MLKESSGILLDLYESKHKGVNVFWIIEQDGRRKKYFHQLPITFYIYSTNENLRNAWIYLKKNGLLMLFFLKKKKLIRLMENQKIF